MRRRKVRLELPHPASYGWLGHLASWSVRPVCPSPELRLPPPAARAGFFMTKLSPPLQELS